MEWHRQGSSRVKAKPSAGIPKTQTTKDCWVTGRDDSDIKDDNETVPFRFTIFSLGIIGCIPCTWKKPHSPSVHPMKSTFILAVLVYIGIGYSSYGFFSEFGGQLRRRESLQERILGLEVAALTLYYFITLSLWVDVPKANRAIQLWIQLGILYRQVLGRRMSMRWRTREKFLTAMSFFIPAAGVYFSRQTMAVEIANAHAPALIYNIVLVTSICAMWIGHFGSLENLAKDVNLKLKNDLQQNSFSVEKFRTYRKIWSDIKSLSDLLSSFTATILVCVFNISVLIVTIYSGILLLQKGNFYFAAVHIIFCSLYVVLMVAMARRSHNAVEEIKRFYSDIISFESIENMTGCIPQEVIHLYFVEKTGSIVPTFSGYVLVNKHLVSSIISAITTHLVILVQFMSSGKSGQ